MSPELQRQLEKVRQLFETYQLIHADITHTPRSRRLIRQIRAEAEEFKRMELAEYEAGTTRP